MHVMRSFSDAVDKIVFAYMAIGLRALHQGRECGIDQVDFVLGDEDGSTDVTMYAYLDDEELTDGDPLIASFDIEKPMTEAELVELIGEYRKRFNELADRAIGEISEVLVKRSRRGLPERRDEE